MIIDFGHCRDTTFPRAQTNFWFAARSSSEQAQAQFLSFTKPLDRQSSHFHAAGEEN